MSDRVTVEVIAPVDGPTDRFGIRVEKELLRVETMALSRVIRPVDAIAVEGAGSHIRQIGMPDVVRRISESDGGGRLCWFIWIKEAELDASGVL
jgi:hypothetical protein